MAASLRSVFPAALEIAYPYQSFTTLEALRKSPLTDRQLLLLISRGTYTSSPPTTVYPRMATPPFTSSFDGDGNFIISFQGDPLPLIILERLALLDYGRKSDYCDIFPHQKEYFYLPPYTVDAGRMWTTGRLFLHSLGPDHCGELLAGALLDYCAESTSARGLQTVAHKFVPLIGSGHLTSEAIKDLVVALTEGDLQLLHEVAETQSRLGELAVTISAAVQESLSFRGAVLHAEGFKSIDKAAAFLAGVASVNLPLLPSNSASYHHVGGALITFKKLSELEDDDVIVLRDPRPSPKELMQFLKGSSQPLICGNKVVVKRQGGRTNMTRLTGRRVSGLDLKALAACMSGLSGEEDLALPAEQVAVVVQSGSDSFDELVLETESGQCSESESVSL